MSRSGPYALLLLAALSFLVSTRPDWWGGALVAVGVEVDGAWLRAAGRIALLGGAFLATAVWGQGVAAENRPLAAALGLGLLLAGVLAQWRVSEASETPSDANDDAP